MRIILLCIAVSCCAFHLSAQDIVWERILGKGTVEIDKEDMQLIGFSPNGDIFANGIPLTGVYRSTNGGEYWEGVYKGLPVNRSAQHLNYDSRGHLWMVMQEGDLYTSDDNGNTWSQVQMAQKPSGMAPFNIFISREDILIVVARSLDVEADNFVMRSEDYGVTWHQCTLHVNSNRILKITALAEDGRGNIFAAEFGSIGVMHSTDGGLNWLPILVETEAFTQNVEWFKAIAVNSHGHVFAGSYHSGLFRTTDQGITWEQVDFGGDHPGIVGIARNTEDHIFIATRNRGGIYCSKDNGESWENIGSGLISDKGLTSAILSPDGKLYIRVINGSLFRTKQSTVWSDEEFSTVSGTVYFDDNADCIQDAGEAGMKNRIVRFDPGPYYAWTNEEGNYEIRLAPNNYSARLIPRANFEQICPAAHKSYSLNISAADQVRSEVDFAADGVADIRELSLSVSGARARPGFTVNYTIRYKNVGTVPYSGQVLFEHDAWFTFKQASPSPESYSPNSAVWNIVNLPVDAAGFIVIQMTLDRETPAGSVVCSYVYTNGDGDPELLAEHYDEFCHEVRNSFDPNDISVSPEGRLGKHDHKLSYTIRFQNTGTAPASRVVVTDELPLELDIESLELGTASHDFTFSISGSRVATWTFDNIELPDSNANEPESHGYFKFRIDRHADLEEGTLIPNQAAIYFDFNDPVITNTVENYIAGNPTSLDEQPNVPRVELYPNPATDVFMIRSEQPLTGDLLIFDSAGRRVLHIRALNKHNASIDVSGFRVGRYYLQIPTKSGTAVRAFEIVR